jgi:hypothetical protein
MSDIDLSATATAATTDDTSKDADTIGILSSELIAKITEQYFNKVMFKQRVSVVDLKPTANGYMFSIAFVEEVKAMPLVNVMDIQKQQDAKRVTKLGAGEINQQPEMSTFVGNNQMHPTTQHRNSHGQFTKSVISTDE